MPDSPKGIWSDSQESNTAQIMDNTTLATIRIYAAVTMTIVGFRECEQGVHTLWLMPQITKLLHLESANSLWFALLLELRELRFPVANLEETWSVREDASGVMKVAFNVWEIPPYPFLL